MRHEALGFPSFSFINAYGGEETVLKEAVRMFPIHDVPQDANIIALHIIVKVKIHDDESLLLQARIAPHGEEDELKKRCFEVTAPYVVQSGCEGACPPLHLQDVH